MCSNPGDLSEVAENGKLLALACMAATKHIKRALSLSNAGMTLLFASFFSLQLASSCYTRPDVLQCL